MGIFDFLQKFSSTAYSMQTLHSTGKYFANQLPKSETPSTAYNSLTMKCPESAKVDIPVVVGGTSPPGLVELYSQTQLERTVYPENGEWYTSIYFSVSGVYKLYARHQGDVVSCEVTVTD